MWHLLFLAAIASVGYVNADHEVFLFDSVTMPANPQAANLRQAFAELCIAPYAPGSQVSYLTFALNHAANKAFGLDGFDVTGFLVGNVLVHALNTCLVYLLISAMLARVGAAPSRAGWIPLAAAVLFAAHPLNASSVAYIVQRRGALATTFYVLAVLAYLRARDFPDARPGRSRGSRRGRIVLAASVLVFGWLSCRSKAMGMTLPVAILMTEFCLRAPDRRALGRYIAVLLPGLALCLVGMLVFLWSRELFVPGQLTIVPWGTEQLWGPWPHLLTESRAFIHYWKLLLLPLPQWSCIDHYLPPSMRLSDHLAFIAMGVHAFLLVVALAAALKRHTLAAMGIFWFYIALIPYAILPQTELLVEYKTYLPGVGFVLIVAQCLLWLSRRVRPVYLKALAAIVAVVFLTLTVRRNVIYQSRLNLWTDAVEKYPEDPVLNTNLGYALADAGRLDEAMRHYRTALQHQPVFPPAHQGLAQAHLARGRLAEAAEHLRAADGIDPKVCKPSAHLNLAGAFLDQGDSDSAIREYHNAIRARPDFAKAHYGLGNALTAKGAFREAIESFRRCLSIRPDYAEAHVNLGYALASSGDFEAAIEAYQEAVRLTRGQPDSDAGFKAHFNLAMAYSQSGQAKAAVNEYRTALDLRPSHAGAQAGLRAALEQVNRTGRRE